MNLSITRACNNNCFFCFQGKHSSDFNECKHMETEDVIKILKWYNHFTPKIGILGGEPTLHPKFFDICNICYSYGYITSICTNLCTDIDVERLLDLPRCSMLINIHHSDTLNDTFMRNYKKICAASRALQGTDRSLDKGSISLGITITNNDDYNTKMISFLKSLLLLDTNQNISHIRISHAVPYSKNKDYKLNYKFGDTCISLIQECFKINRLLDAGFDCSINPCYVGLDNFEKLKASKSKISFTTECDGPVWDITPDFTTTWCDCLPKTYNIFDYQNPQILYNKMFKDYTLDRKKLIHVCDNCNCLDCNGFCNAICYNLDENFKLNKFEELSVNEKDVLL